MPCPRCVGECHCALGRADERTVLVDPEGYDPSEEQFSQSLVAARHPEPRETVAVPPVENGNPVNEPVWRHEVAQRLTRYRSRRGHAAHNQSLSFNFDPLPEAPVTMEPIA